MGLIRDVAMEKSSTLWQITQIAGSGLFLVLFCFLFIIIFYFCLEWGGLKGDRPENLKSCGYRVTRKDKLRYLYQVNYRIPDLVEP